MTKVLDIRTKMFRCTIWVSPEIKRNKKTCCKTVALVLASPFPNFPVKPKSWWRLGSKISIPSRALVNGLTLRKQKNSHVFRRFFLKFICWSWMNAMVILGPKTVHSFIHEFDGELLAKWFWRRTASSPFQTKNSRRRAYLRLRQPDVVCAQHSAGRNGRQRKSALPRARSTKRISWKIRLTCAKSPNELFIRSNICFDVLRQAVVRNGLTLIVDIQPPCQRQTILRTFRAKSIANFCVTALIRFKITVQIETGVIEMLIARPMDVAVLDFSFAFLRAAHVSPPVTYTICMRKAKSV